MKLTLIKGETGFRKCKRGLMVTMAGEHTFTQFFIPRASYVSAAVYGDSVLVRIGRNLTLTMPYGMWADKDTDIIAAAMGEDAVL